MRMRNLVVVEMKCLIWCMCVAAVGVLQGSVLARSQDCGPAPARHGSSTQPWPPSCHHSHNYNLQHWLGSRLWPHSHLDSLFMFQVSMLIQLPARIMDYTKLCCPSPCLVPAIFWFSSYSISLQLEGLSHDLLFHNSLLLSFIAFLAFIEILC